MRLTSRSLVALLVGCLLAVALPGAPGDAAPSGPPVRVGGTLGLTGPLAPTAIIPKIVGEIAVEQLNRKNGLLGRPVEYVLLDDQSKPDVARTLYERLVTQDKVDLLIGAFGTAANLSAIAVAQRHGKLLISNTFAVPKLSTYEMHFPTQGIGPEPDRMIPTLVFDALASTGRPPRTVAIVASKFPSLHFISVGGRELAPKRGISVPLFLEFEFGTRDFGPIAARIRDANPDFLWIGGLGLDGNMLLDALKKIDHTPRGHLTFFPAPGPMIPHPLGNYAFALSPFEEHPPFTDNPVAAEFVKLFNERSAKVGLPYTKVENQSAIAYTSWQAFEAAVNATKSLDDKVLARWLKANRVQTIIGTLRFDGPHNFGDTLYRVKQLQNGRWVIVWPKEFAAPGARVIYPAQ